MMSVQLNSDNKIAYITDKNHKITIKVENSKLSKQLKLNVV